MTSLTRADVEHVAFLARLGLDDAELTVLEGQLNHILDQFRILAALDTAAIPPTAQVIEVENTLREDAPGTCLPVDGALAGAPERTAEHFVVPVIVEGGVP